MFPLLAEESFDKGNLLRNVRALLGGSEYFEVLEAAILEAAIKTDYINHMDDMGYHARFLAYLHLMSADTRNPIKMSTFNPETIDEDLEEALRILNGRAIKKYPKEFERFMTLTRISCRMATEKDWTALDNMIKQGV